MYLREMSNFLWKLVMVPIQKSYAQFIVGNDDLMVPIQKSYAQLFMETRHHFRHRKKRLIVSISHQPCNLNFKFHLNSNFTSKT